MEEWGGGMDREDAKIQHTCVCVCTQGVSKKKEEKINSLWVWSD